MASDAVINSRYAVVITRHRTQSGEPGASVADGVQDADTAPEPRPAEPATPSTAALRSAGVDDFCMVDEAVDHGGCYHDLDLEISGLSWGFMFWTGVCDDVHLRFPVCVGGGRRMKPSMEPNMCSA